MAFLFFNGKTRNPKELTDLDYIKSIGKGRSSGSIARKLSIDRKAAEDTLEVLRSQGLVGLYSDSGTWFVTSNGESKLQSAS